MATLPTVEIVDANGGNRRVINEKDLPEWEKRGYACKRPASNPADALSNEPPNPEDTHPNGKSPIDPPIDPPAVSSEPGSGSDRGSNENANTDSTTKWFAVEMPDGSTDVFPNQPPQDASVRGVFASQDEARASLNPQNPPASGSD